MRVFLPAHKDALRLYDAFSIPLKLETPIVAAEDSGKYVGYLATSYTDNGIPVCGPGETKYDGQKAIRMWMALHNVYDAAFPMWGYGGYLVWLDERDTHWNSIVRRYCVERRKIFTIIGQERGKFWYKRIYTEADHGRRQERASARNDA